MKAPALRAPGLIFSFMAAAPCGGVSSTASPINLCATWLLVREKQEHYHNLDIDKRTKERTIEAEELSGITIDNFYSVLHFTGQKWKVVAAKIFFYNAPKLGSKTRKAYLVPGDVVIAYRELTNFEQVNFTNQKTNSTLPALF